MRANLFQKIKMRSHLYQKKISRGHFDAALCVNSAGARTNLQKEVFLATLVAPDFTLVSESLGWS